MWPPASAGDALAGTYGAFKTYTRAMLAFALAPRPGVAKAPPLVAYGHPVRAWVESELGVALGVLSLGSITFSGGQAVPVLGANHPSFTWHAAQQPDARALAMKVMKQNLIAACWQAGIVCPPSLSRRVRACMTYPCPVVQAAQPSVAVPPRAPGSDFPSHACEGP